MTPEQAQAAAQLVYRRLLAFDAGAAPHELTLTLTFHDETPEACRVAGYQDLRPSLSKRRAHLALVDKAGASGVD